MIEYFQLNIEYLRDPFKILLMKRQSVPTSPS